VVANNSYLARLLVEKMGVAVSSVIYDGVDRRFFYSNGVTNRGSEVSVLFAGSFRPLKRAPLVIRQAAQFPEVRFRLAGSGEEEQVCKNLAAELGCKNVEFLGHLSQQQLGEVMREADIFFFPSILEGHPQVLVQAAASGLPVIAMNVYRPDYVRNGITGFLVDADEDLSSKLEELIGNRENREAMGKAAVEHVRQFDWDTIAKTWQDLFTHTVTHRQQHCLRTSTA
jgi:glycosyltransferase involved in cell wall biosynthesis